MEDKNNVIPFVKPVRVGNYKLWRSKNILTYVPTDEERKKVREESNGRSKAVNKKVDIEVINVSNLDGSFKVQIPSTSEMYGLICQQYAENSERFLTMLFGNFLNVCTSANAALHDGLFFLTEILSFPYLLLPEKDMVKRMKDVYKERSIDKKVADKQIDEMVEYRKKVYELIDKKKSRFLEDYERIQEERRDREEKALRELDYDDIAEQSMDMLKEEKTS